MVKTSYLAYAFTGLLVWIILNNMDNEFKWVALGFGGMMLLIGLFKKDRVVSDEEVGEEIEIEEDNKEIETDNLNKIGGNNNDI